MLLPGEESAIHRDCPKFPTRPAHRFARHLVDMGLCRLLRECSASSPCGWYGNPETTGDWEHWGRRPSQLANKKCRGFPRYRSL
jgi:hypothetical protein